MDQYVINHSKEPIRVFKSDFLEFFTHVHPITIIVIWVPYSIYMFTSGYAVSGPRSGLAALPLSFLVGFLVWTFVEYNIHRFFFHFHPRAAWQERIVFLFHGVHHAQPRLKTRLVMPPAVSIPLALVFYGALHLIVGVALGASHWVAPMFAGLLAGYLVYDLTHYATHHLPMNGRYLKFLKKYHMLHHFKTPDQRFGVSSPLWDRVFGTYPA